MPVLMAKPPNGVVRRRRRRKPLSQCNPTIARRCVDDPYDADAAMMDTPVSSCCHHVGVRALPAGDHRLAILVITAVARRARRRDDVLRRAATPAARVAPRQKHDHRHDHEHAFHAPIPLRRRRPKAVSGRSPDKTHRAAAGYGPL